MNRYGNVRVEVERAAVKAGRDPAGITLVAVSKTQPLELVEELYQKGHRDFGENYVQDLVEKAQALEARGCNGIRWHFIGHLQTNKVRQVVPWVDCVHAVDSEKVALVLARQWKEKGKVPHARLPVFIEVNLSGAASKSGVATSEARALAEKLAGEVPELEILGLMAIPEASAGLPAGEAEIRLAARFAELRELESRCHPYTRGKLSMGMSQDYPLAIAQGATHVRVGTALFGPRR